MKIIVIGGGAAGYFAAIKAKESNTKAEVQIFEKTSKVLSKVKVSGGGRCNVTNATFNNRLLSEKYPRGEKFLRKAFEQFNAKSTVDWFEERKVPLKTYPDLCIFPLSNDSQTIVSLFQTEAYRLGIDVFLYHGVEEIEKVENGFELTLKDSKVFAHKVIVTVGGQTKLSYLHWIEQLGHPIVSPVPSLFTFNMPHENIKELMGIVVEKTKVRIEGKKLLGSGPLLVTHWGMSGPAILQLSAWGARILEEMNYEFSILVNWLDEMKEQELREKIEQTIKEHGGKMLSNFNPFPFPNRLWQYLLAKNEIIPATRWCDTGGKNINKLINTLLNDRYKVQGKTTFKEEFVTAGGVDLEAINVQTMESKICPGLYFAGEVMDIDGITGGFNFQAAWTTGWIAGKNAANEV